MCWHVLRFECRILLAGKGISTMDYPPYSPDLAPADVWLFPKLKSVLKGKRFSDVEDIC
jgi:hypothetical protein